MLSYVSYYFVYSFAGFILESLFAFVVQGDITMRKCFLFFPMCPVYGIGAILIILATEGVAKNLFAVFGIGAIAATLTEFVMDIIYKEFIGVTFWDYSDMPLNINGRVCLLFSLIWGLLSVFLVKYIHPGVLKAVSRIPNELVLGVLSIFVIDAVASTMVLVKFKTKAALSLFSLFR